ncbi:hypothetical protein DKG77_03460 [Flagellimonas aquimarina]|uniref:Uncharacterized protein n=1 Tax=Flagellimonas aquimarina TaxID=2201895 RepID=A0A316LIH8_9FLAO|nr:hypothetical protein [Allomuricauda koreensis]PWL39900.1 hypothetical protein DKG77_03460 [Allomuricauda koreensis]
MEGFDPTGVGKSSSLDRKKLDAVVLTEEGYPSKENQYLPKVRKTKESLFKKIAPNHNRSINNIGHLVAISKVLFGALERGSRKNT